MFANLNIFRIAGSMMAHAGARQTLVARNIANADTPGYQPKDLTPFSNASDATTPHLSLRAKRAGHISNTLPLARFAVEQADDGPGKPNGNSVSIEAEMVRAADIKREHDLALSVYQASLNILKASIGRRG